MMYLRAARHQGEGQVRPGVEPRHDCISDVCRALTAVRHYSCVVAQRLRILWQRMTLPFGVYGELFCLAMMLPPEKRFHG